eukprot:TRINITY_DN9300_c0_g1_i1.p1 TRINITY_DN9300_c0_g1~~TRINITY_DN9300_c0_g1_i1.p1  ORF type:complete len:826 (-),score=143.16 TRINITY_DN9300_c0_g1_i1:53-2530(-)
MEFKITAHQTSIDQLMEDLQTKPSGLTLLEREHRLMTTHPNHIPSFIIQKGTLLRSWGILPIVAILLFVVVLQWVLYWVHYGTAEVALDTDAIVIVTLYFIIMCIFLSYLVKKINSLFARRAHPTISECTVLIDNSPTLVNETTLVVGDIIQLKPGMLVPADIRIIESNFLVLDTSKLTGESNPTRLYASSFDLNHWCSPNLALFGTLVLKGNGLGVVFNTGVDTLMGSLDASRVNQPLDFSSELVNNTSNRMMVVGFISSIAVFALSFVLHRDLISSIIAASMAIFVSFPKGIVFGYVISLASYIEKLEKNNNICVKNEKSEQLRKATVICADKTGTLTNNKLSVCGVWYDFEEYSWSVPDINEVSAHSDIFQIAKLASCGYSSRMDKIITDFYNEIDFPKLNGYTQVFSMPFSNYLKYSVGIYKQPHKEDNRLYLVMMGALERMLVHCKYIKINGEAKEITDEIQERILSEYHRICQTGVMCLTFCEYYLDECYDIDYTFSTGENNRDFNFPIEDITFVGFVQLLDLPKKGISETIDDLACKNIKVIMISGDHNMISRNIAERIGLISQDSHTTIFRNDDDTEECDSLVVIGRNLKDTFENDELWDEILDHKEVIFSECNPNVKNYIVMHLKRRGETVICIGDGTGDGPALQTAHVGISMGSGTDIAKEASDYVLMGDNFESVVTLIDESRELFLNWRNIVQYSISLLIVYALAALMVLMDIPLPLNYTTLLLGDLLINALFTVNWILYDRRNSCHHSKENSNETWDKLITLKTIASSIKTGLILFLGCLFVYFTVFSLHGIYPVEYHEVINDLIILIKTTFV